ncbi:MAG: ABC transporter substrate binding protein [Woeseiaceae bacterium]|nr:ABC transporter substrate binding protein [Woeseiaceae bacterium]
MRNLLIVCGLASAGGCVQFAPEVVPDEPPPEIVAAPEPAEPEPAAPKRIIEPPPPARISAVAIVLAGSNPAYTAVAEALVGELDESAVYDLGDRSRPPVTVLRAINDSPARAVVAIGLRAAQSSVAMAEVPVVFSQVFNYQEHGLVTANSRGVAALPPVAIQLATFRDFDPSLKRIGTIIGPGHDALIADAEAAAAALGLELVAHVSGSDQETLYHYRRMIRDIDGFWLLPDNRILSRRALDEMLLEAGRRDVPVAVPNDAMLAMGGSLSLSAVPADVAQTIVRVLRQIEAGRFAGLPDVTALSEIRVQTPDSVRVADR